MALAQGRERASRAALMDLFAAHLSAPVAAEIWRHRAELLAGGRLKPASLVATVLFSDVENFTPASEALGPERLMDWIETYLEAMTEIVTGHGGVVLDRRTRMLYDESHVFINGESFRAAGRDATLMHELADRRALDARRVRRLTDAAAQLLWAWAEAGWLHADGKGTA